MTLMKLPATTRIGCLVASLCFIPLAEAKKPAKPPGGGGGGNDPSGYTIVHLETGFDTDIQYIEVSDINEHDPATDHQDVVGRASDSSGAIHAFAWTVTGESVQTTALLGGSQTEPLGINDNDQIVGWDESNLTPMFWPDPSSTPLGLPLLSGHTNGVAESINNQGVIIGSCWGLATAYRRPVAWQTGYVDGALVISDALDLGALSSNFDTAYCIDVSNEDSLITRIVGISRDDDNNTRSVTWELLSAIDEHGVPQMAVLSGPTDLGTLAGDSSNTARAMNHSGDVCGFPGSITLLGMPMLPMADLYANSGGLSDPRDINDLTEIVGKFRYGTGEQATVLWQADGTPVDLNKFTGGTRWSYLDDAAAINNRGAIAGWGTRYLTRKRNSPRVRGAFLMIPQ